VPVLGRVRLDLFLDRLKLGEWGGGGGVVAGKWWLASIALCYSASLSFTHLMWLSNAVSIFVWGSSERIDCKLPACHCACEGVPKLFFCDSQECKHACEPRTCQYDDTVFSMSASVLSSISLVLYKCSDEGVALTHYCLESEQSSSREFRSPTMKHASVVY